ncbi:MAG: ferrous iron transport protein A [Firmicutes bacterium]|nr:ferrous iron transport protein A [Bacillota bacterium]
MEEVQTLTELPLGRRGIITGLTVRDPARRRLLELGFIPGTLIEAIRRSPAGEPTAFRLRETVVALRREEARQISIHLLPE